MKSGQIKARTKWKEVYPTFASDSRYLDILGNPGSNPLELFWDLVDGLDQQLDAKIAVAEGAIKRHNQQLETKAPEVEKPGEDAKGHSESGFKPFKVDPETTEDQFFAVINGDDDDAVRKLSTEDLHEVYHTVSLAPIYVTEVTGF